MRPIATVALATLALVASPVGTPKAVASTPYAQLAVVPDAARTRANPLETDPAAIVAGRKLYERHCVECHGANADDGTKGPSLRAAEVQQAPPGALFWVITNGNVRSGMPVWSRLPDPQRWQIVTYLKSLGPAAAPARD